jgi:hypothetical protein
MGETEVLSAEFEDQGTSAFRPPRLFVSGSHRSATVFVEQAALPCYLLVAGIFSDLNP